MTYMRQTAQGNGYGQEDTTLYQLARAQRPSSISEDEVSTLYGVYDTMMIDLMGDTFLQTEVDLAGTVTYAKLRRIVATPDRAFASMARQMGVPVDHVPLPFGSLSRTGEVHDPTRQNRHVIRKGLSYDSRNVEMHEYPYPVNLSYTFQIWCRTLNDSDVFLEQCMMLGWYGTLYYVGVNHPRRVGQQLIPIEWTGTDRVENKEPGADKDRDIRRVFNFTVYGWVPRRIVDKRAVHKIYLEKWTVARTADLDDVQDSDLEDLVGTDLLADETDAISEDG